MSTEHARPQLFQAPVGPDPGPRFGWILGLTSTAYFMVILDALVVVTALPRMGHDLHVGIPTLQWTVNAYGITVAAGIITAAALGDRLGRRRIFVCGVALFTLRRRHARWRPARHC
jgi:predicted MFS family arabinose efflux permease